MKTLDVVDRTSRELLPLPASTTLRMFTTSQKFHFSTARLGPGPRPEVELFLIEFNTIFLHTEFLVPETQN